MAKRSSEFVELHKAADSFESRFRSEFVKSMKALQAKVSINDLALRIMQRKRTAPPLVSRKAIAEAVAPIEKVTTAAFKRGGKLGTDRLHKLGARNA